MADILYKTPLLWPQQRTQTHPSMRSMPLGVSPTLSFSESLEYLKTEAFVFPTDQITLYTNYEKIWDNSLRKKIGNSSSGASLTFSYESTHFLIPCDHWSTTAHNIYALHLMLRHTMQMVKWGLGPLSLILQGFVSNNATAANTDEWWMQLLGLGATARVADANAVYRARAKEIASDEKALLRLNEAIAMARLHLL